MKNTVALAWGERVVLSPHLGDLSSPSTWQRVLSLVQDWQHLYRVQVGQAVLDAHPAHPGHAWIRQQGWAGHRVWHHHAHASAWWLEAELAMPQLSLVWAWDGTGLGPNHQNWGGETLVGRPGAWQHVAQIQPFRLPGGDVASREPWRVAAALCWSLGLAPLDRPESVSEPSLQLLQQGWQRGLHCPWTSSCGRLFDGFASLLGVCQQSSYEGEAAMRLEALAQEAGCGPAWPVHWQRNEQGLWQLDWSAWVRAVHAGRSTQAATRQQRAEWAWALHDALARALLKLLQLLHWQGPVGLSGGVFQNQLLQQRVSEHLFAHDVRWPQAVPCNDAGVAVGQMVEAWSCHQGSMEGKTA